MCCIILEECVSTGGAMKDCVLNVWSKLTLTQTVTMHKVNIVCHITADTGTCIKTAHSLHMTYVEVTSTAKGRFLELGKGAALSRHGNVAVMDWWHQVERNNLNYTKFLLALV